MIRFVRVGDQVDEGEDAFAFYDTVREEFVDFGGSQLFDSVEEFLSWTEGCGLAADFLRRCKSLIPSERLEGVARARCAQCLGEGRVAATTTTLRSRSFEYSATCSHCDGIGRCGCLACVEAAAAEEPT